MIFDWSVSIPTLIGIIGALAACIAWLVNLGKKAKAIEDTQKLLEEFKRDLVKQEADLENKHLDNLNRFEKLNASISTQRDWTQQNFATNVELDRRERQTNASIQDVTRQLESIRNTLQNMPMVIVEALTNRNRN